MSASVQLRGRLRSVFPGRRHWLNAVGSTDLERAVRSTCISAGIALPE